MKLAMAVGSFTGLIIMLYLDSKTIFIATTVFAVVSLVIALFTNVPERPVTPQEKSGKKKLQISDFFERSAMPMAIFMLIVGLANSSILSFINAYAIEIDLVDAASFFFEIGRVHV